MGVATGHCKGMVVIALLIRIAHCARRTVEDSAAYGLLPQRCAAVRKTLEVPTAAPHSAGEYFARSVAYKRICVAYCRVWHLRTA